MLLLKLGGFWLVPPRDFPHSLRVTLWITTAIHLDTPKVKTRPYCLWFDRGFLNQRFLVAFDRSVVQFNLRLILASNTSRKYLLPLDDEIAERIKALAKILSIVRATSETSDTPGVHPGEGRAARTVAL
jgi:hypothetical protein